MTAGDEQIDRSAASQQVVAVKISPYLAEVKLDQLTFVTTRGVRLGSYPCGTVRTPKLTFALTLYVTFQKRIFFPLRKTKPAGDRHGDPFARYIASNIWSECDMRKRVEK
ncbi:hypothetical protein CNYM01_14271 [Colletotrichum nymphaeae SA-01]|uniref:Uncharacterized protein n=1 Tax=Colletotrichum nymphaeae SA-01 TaxID=1460502 RepID=A0A135ST48_9PEZI|nr:hypothetical protein CNYM01_14271 [Colletotrichum nymphaeae SA-01]